MVVKTIEATMDELSGELGELLKRINVVVGKVEAAIEALS